MKIKRILGWNSLIIEKRNSVWHDTKAYSEPCQTSNMEHFAKESTNVNYFLETLYLRCLTGFWIRLRATHRSSYRGCFVKEGVLRNFANFKGRHLCQKLFFKKIAGLGPATLLKRRLWHRCSFLWILWNF